MAHRFMLNKLLLVLLVLPSIAAALVVNIPQTLAYDNYEACVQGESVAFAPNGQLSDRDFDQIEAACRREFPAQTTPSPQSSVRPRATASSTPRVTSTNSPSASMSPVPSSSSSADPSSDLSVTQSPANSLQSSIPQQSPAARSTASSSASINGSNLGSDNRPIFDRIVPPRSTDVLTPGFATQDSPSITSLVNYLFDFMVRRLLPLIAGVLVVVITWGGYQYIMAQGDSGKAKQAKDTILFGIIGLVLALAALSIVTILNSILLQS